MKFLNTIIIVFILSNITLAQVANKMTLLSQWDADTFPLVFAGQYSDCWGITAPNGKEYAVIGSTPYIHFFDITNETNPVEVGTFAGGNVSLWREFKSYKDHVYAVADQGQEGLIIFDCKNAPNIVKTNQTTQFSARTHMPFIDEKNGRLYLAGTNTQNNGIIVLDLTEDPNNPKLLGSVALPGGYVHDLFVRDNIAYCSHGNNGLWAYDFTDAKNPVLLGNMTSYPESGYNHSTWMTEDNKYLIQCDETHNTSVKVVDIQDLSDIKVVDLFKSTLLAPNFTNSIGHNPYVRGDYSIISYYHDGVQVYDLKNPLDVKNVAWYDTEPDNTTYDGYDGLWGVYPFFESDKLVLSDLNNGLFIVKLTDIDLDSIHTTGLPDPVLNYSGNIKICQGDKLTLTIPAGAQFINWYKDGKMVQSEGTDFEISTPGTYKAVTWSHSNIKESASVDVSFSTLTSPSISTINGEAGLCPGESAELCSNTNTVNIKWTLDGNLLPLTQKCITAITGGVYKSISTDGLCERSSNELTLESYSAPIAAITPTAETLCPNEVANLNVTPNATSWQWFLNGNEIPGANQANYSTSAAGTYSVIIKNDFCTTESENAIIKLATPIIPSIAETMDTLKSTPASFYQWYLNGVLLQGATGQTYLAKESGTYFVETTDANGCISVSAPLGVFITNLTEPTQASINLFPNPAHNMITVSLNPEHKFTEWNIRTIDGKLLLSGTFSQNLQKDIALESLTPGIYVLECKSNESFYFKLIKE